MNEDIMHLQNRIRDLESKISIGIDGVNSKSTNKVEKTDAGNSAQKEFAQSLNQRRDFIKSKMLEMDLNESMNKL